jgi:hypothetical protein
LYIRSLLRPIEGGGGGVWAFNEKPNRSEVPTRTAQRENTHFLKYIATNIRKFGVKPMPLLGAERVVTNPKIKLPTSRLHGYWSEKVYLGHLAEVQTEPTRLDERIGLLSAVEHSASNRPTVSA